MKIIAGDIGGTKTLLQLVEVNGGQLDFKYKKRYPSGEFGDFNTVLESFISEVENPSIATACIGVAGPVKGETASVTNLPWKLNSSHLQQRFNINTVSLINDFQAVGYGINSLQINDLVSLQQGEPQKQGVRAVIGAGTGLGEGFLIWQNNQYVVYPSEGGHNEFAPSSDVQIDLLRFLKKREDHISYEKILSGRGLYNIFQFVSGKHNVSYAQLRQVDETAAYITGKGMQNGDPIAIETLDLFISIYGAQAGSLALTCMASGGVYIAGGIAPRIVKALQQPQFLQAFHNKGKMSDLMSSFPVHVVVNPQVGLLGAIAVAEELAIACTPGMQ